MRICGIALFESIFVLFRGYGPGKMRFKYREVFRNLAVFDCILLSVRFAIYLYMVPIAGDANCCSVKRKAVDLKKLM